ncbi:2-oxo acid dehydrogenase subunit E2 [Ruixingdingia sedimenti]|uniref:Dihydrolipoamide acetyltransferase component of pyruvate dehydrogenase complex n=1 Tax=Ruixingdingia sedimenti TaxID=3073604 RepID=A0ABU1F481_9RHOB|nr:2-oxo acid dehydrogenase subunit E2 [Xinfangfangia sp. LG-4]MDR5651473.1 2-oxo acid dehydrogenase subunit E2 [Xinfangfangia sp. LG-4]
MTRLIELRVPDIGDFKDVPVVEITVAPGDMVARDQTVAMLESDKATLDIPATEPGRVAEIRVKPGDRVGEGSVLMLLEAAEAEAAEAPAPVPAEPAPVAAPAPLPAAPVVAPAPAPEDSTLPPHASPAVRKFARELGVEVTRVTGTGPRGRITREDVQAHVKAALSAPAAPATGGVGAGLPAWPQVDHAKFGPVTREPLSRIRRISGPALSRNALVIPHVTNFDEADITELESFRKTVNAEGGTKLSILPFAVKAAVAVLKAYPSFNASLDGDALVLKQYWNIGVAADTPDGLVVPVIKAADRKGIYEIAGEMAALAADARAGRLKAADMQGASFTISSLGGVGGTGFTPIINAPEVAILGLARAAVKPVWDGAAFQPRLILPMSLSWDHRVVDGVAAARFLGALGAILADFRRIAL